MPICICIQRASVCVSNGLSSEVGSVSIVGSPPPMGILYLPATNSPCRSQLRTSERLRLTYKRRAGTSTVPGNNRLNSAKSALLIREENLGIVQRTRQASASQQKALLNSG